MRFFCGRSQWSFTQENVPISRTESSDKVRRQIYIRDLSLLGPDSSLVLIIL